MEYRRQQIARWEKCIPPLDGEWTLWWLEGDGGVLLITRDLRELLGKIEENYERNLRQIVYLAKNDSEGNAIRDERRYEVVNLEVDAAYGWYKTEKTPISN